MALKLDFTGLDNISREKPNEKGKSFTEATEQPQSKIKGQEGIEIPPEAFKTLLQAENSPKEENTDKAALVRLAKEQELHKGLSEAYKECQNNIKRSETLRTEILKGVSAGEDIQSLFLKAAECISRMTGDSVFLDQIKKRIM